MADLGCARERVGAPLTPFFLFSCSFRQKSCQIIGYDPHPGVDTPLWAILDPPISGQFWLNQQSLLQWVEAASPNLTCLDENQLVIVNKYWYFPNISACSSGQVSWKSTCLTVNPLVTDDRTNVNSAIHKAAGLKVPGHSMICLVLFHPSTVPTVKPSMGEWPLGGGSN